MRRTIIVLFAITLLSPVFAAAQDWVARQAEGGGKFRLHQAGRATYEFIGSEFSFSNEVVKGAPYSAQAVTRTTQLLGDGNRIVRETIARVYRDSEGRTRREQELPTIGNWVPESDHQIITISDPVGGISYSLNPDSREASRMERPKFNFVIRTRGGEAGAPAAEDREVVVRTESSTFNSKQHRVIVSGGGEGPEALTGELERIKVAPFPEGSETASESLGTRTIEGVLAEGTRTIMTIPAGRIGNELPIEAVTERWFSPELETVVLRRHYDPRFGETLYQLLNIDQSEPDPALFEVPATYTITEGGNSFLHLKEKPEPLKKRPNQP